MEKQDQHTLTQGLGTLPHAAQLSRQNCSGIQGLSGSLTSHRSQHFGVFLSTMPADTDPSSLVWYTDPDFVAARNHVIPPDGRSAYSKFCLLLFITSFS